MDFRRFAYMSWAKRHYFDAEISLVPSGMAWPTRSTFPLCFEGDASFEPYREVGFDDPGGLHEAIARAYGFDQGGIVAALGSTQTYELAYCTLLEPGDEVLIERPGYEVFDCFASIRGHASRSFERDPDADFDLDVAKIVEALRPETKLVVLTSVHNPSGRLASEATLHELGEACERFGIHALVSEGYLDFVDGTTVPLGGGAKTRRFAHEVHPRLLSTNSMTKVYGLGSLRCGWIATSPELAAPMREAREILCPLLPALPVAVAIAALEDPGLLLERARSRAREQRPLLHEALDAAAHLRLVPPQAGIMASVEVLDANGERTASEPFADYLRREHGVGVVPGEHFDAPGFLRVGYGGDGQALREGLARLVTASDAWARSAHA